MPVITTERQKSLIESLSAQAAQRAREEVAVVERDRERSSAATTEHQQQRATAIAEFQRRHAELINTYRQAREAVLLEYESSGLKLAQEEDGFSDRVAEEHARVIDDARHLLSSRTRKTEAQYNEKQVQPQEELAQFKQQCDFVMQELQSLVAQTQKIGRRRIRWPEQLPSPPAAPGLTRQEYLASVTSSFATARAKQQELEHQKIAKFLEDGWPVIIFIFSAVPGAIASYWLLNSYGLPIVGAAALLIPTIIAGGIWAVLKPIARSQALKTIPEFRQAIAQAETDLAAAQASAQSETERALKKLAKRRDRGLEDAQKEYDEVCSEQTTLNQQRLDNAVHDFAARRKAIEDKHERRLTQMEQDYPQQIKKLEDDFSRRMGDLAAAYQARRAANRAEFEREWNEMAAAWSQSLADFRTAAGEMNEFCVSHFPAWNGEVKTPAESNGEASNVAALRFGRYEFDLAKRPAGLPDDQRLEAPAGPFELPAVLSYPECPSLLLEAEEEGRDTATQVIQNVMLRLLTTFPPGKVRFTIIDPVGLGQNFSAFMHLADYDEKLVNNRIWTEGGHINQRLTDLTEHMENVIQKYLRNEFASIQEYNVQAGEVAEAFQILVVANFPANFSDEAARRLVSIAASGARCGVYTLISTDMKLKLPRNFDLKDLESVAATLEWKSDAQRFAWKEPALSELPLVVDAPPGDEQFTDIVRSVGRLAKDSARVEVPFESILPTGQWWGADSRSEIEVPLGRAGAKKLQYMRLGKGTSQHVLIAGKTGSGKSTLLNAMITNLAVHYAPTELQFYLIDFKKGVEFKAYAQHRLPHARVIAIESEREFGMSVLERLDLELKRRGDLFRKHGVQDLKGYRNAEPDAVMPRMLLVIDEFQEFFTTDDKISHDSALLLDRLVRQGRAFGIHVLLGSQTLAGAYSLARSTLGQMAVRIALQCSESDAHLILSEDNTAARLLSRPGEAIYNDANGMFEGNHPFQIVWLSDHQREYYLKQVAEMSQQRQLSLGAPTIFEGNVAADASDNDLLRAALATPTPSPSPRAWLGAAVAIKDPTCVVLRRQAGTNLLIVGQQEDLALGILASCFISLAAETKAASTGENGAKPHKTFYILDGTRPDAPEAGFWRRTVQRVSSDAEVVMPREAGATIKTIAAEVDRRVAANDQAADPIFVIIDNLARFRDLKKSEDFGISRFDEDDSPAADKQLATILREGPAVGVHVLIWCDSYTNLSRWLERNTLRDCDLRALFQMSANDSANLMDSPAASRLGTHMAILYSEEQGQAEKFRPYGVPSEAWLGWVEERLASRAVGLTT
jgi:energy-coupling factor transporter ATP-binding protein EcfA2